MSVLAKDPYGLPEVLVNGATATGTSNSIQWTFQCRPLGGPVNMVLESILTGVFTAFKVDLQVSLDGGTTFKAIEAGIDLFTNGAAAINPVGVPGAIYQLNVSTFTGGTSAVVRGSAS